MKTALVTGAAGFIGTQIVKELCSKGYTVYALIEKNDKRGRDKLGGISDRIDIIEKLKEGYDYSSFDIIYHTAIRSSNKIFIIYASLFTDFFNGLAKIIPLFYYKNFDILFTCFTFLQMNHNLLIGYFI